MPEQPSVLGTDAAWHLATRLTSRLHAAAELDAASTVETALAETALAETAAKFGTVRAALAAAGAPLPALAHS